MGWHLRRWWPAVITADTTMDPILATAITATTPSSIPLKPLPILQPTALLHFHPPTTLHHANISTTTSANHDIICTYQRTARAVVGLVATGQRWLGGSVAIRTTQVVSLRETMELLIFYSESSVCSVLFIAGHYGV